MTSKKTNKAWGNGPVIERINITPEQAVLACCTAAAADYVRFSVGVTTLCQRGTGNSPVAPCAGAALGKGNCQTFIVTTGSTNNTPSS